MYLVQVFFLKELFFNNYSLLTSLLMKYKIKLVWDLTVNYLFSVWLKNSSPKKWPSITLATYGGIKKKEWIRKVQNNDLIWYTIINIICPYKKIILLTTETIYLPQSAFYNLINPYPQSHQLLSRFLNLYLSQQ